MNRSTAIRHAEHGLRVFPCKPGKVPVRGFLWKEWATNNPAEVAAIWDHYGHDCAPAIHLGPCGLVVLDFDRKGGKDGCTAFDALGGDLPRCPAVETPSRGFHAYYRQPPDRTLGNRTGGLPTGVDVRGDGGYVLAPDAILDDGTYYETVAGWPELTAAFFADDIPTIPEWIVDLIEAGAETESDTSLGCPEVAVTVTPCAGAWNTARADAYIEQPLKDRVNTLARMPAETGRNNYLNSAVFHISGLIHHPVLCNTSISQNEVWDAMEWAYSQHPSRKTNARQRFRATFLSGWNSGRFKLCRGPAPDRQAA